LIVRNLLGHIFNCNSIDALLTNIKKSTEYSNIKLVRPFVPKNKRIGISNIEDVIDENYTLHSKWTIIRDIDGYCLNKYLNYNSTVINMDDYGEALESNIRTIIQQAICKGLWVTFSFKETLWTLHHLLIKNILPADIMEPSRVFDEFSLKHIFQSWDRRTSINSLTPSVDETKEEESPTNKSKIFRKETKNNNVFEKNDNFRIIFVSQKLEYPKVMLDTCILVSIDEEKMKIEEDRIKLKWIRGKRKKQPEMFQKELGFVEAWFDGDFEKFKELLHKYPMSANTWDLHENTALMEAALKGHVEIWRELLNHKNANIKINTVNEDDRTALHKAAYNGNPEIVEMLLQNGADPRLVDSSGNRAVDYMENYECKMIIYKWKTEWTDDINRKREEESKKLINNFLYSDELNKEMREKLREYLIASAKAGDYKKIHQIVSIGKASIETRDNNGSSLLSLAVAHGQYNWAEKMIEELSPNVNTRDHKGWTPLMKAVIQNSIKMTRILIEAGADLNIKNNISLKAVELVKTNEMRDFIREEVRKASFFDFEQMLNFQMSLK
jgi:ankyrin repeat protein